jgi:hypothetical protein
MFGFFKSAETKRRERQRDQVTKAIRENVSGAAAEIKYVESKFELAHRRIAAARARNTVVDCERSADSVEALQPEVRSLTAKVGTPLAMGLGMMLGSRLVISGVLLGQLEGRDFLETVPELLALEALLHGFMERQGVEPWPVMYYDEVEFERYRCEELNRQRLELERFERENPN